VLSSAATVSSQSDREHLLALMAAVENPSHAARLPANDARLIAVARQHRLSPLLSATAGNELPPSIAKAFRADRLATVARNLALAHVASECIDALSSAGVRAIVLKGLSYEQILYGAAGVRATGDVDLLVRMESRKEAFAVLDRLGFEPRAAAPGFDEPDYHEVAWKRQDAEVDLHMALVPVVRGRIDYAAIWAQAEPLALGSSPALALSPVHAALFQALHMAVDHFDGPAIYAVDLSRLISRVGDVATLEREAGAWRCRRAFDTALALTARLLPNWARRFAPVPTRFAAARVVRRYGPITPIGRPEQLLRKMLHFDTVADASRYVAVQSRRKVREWIEGGLLKRSPRERLQLPRTQSKQ
jgi:hypothetical protein